MKSFKTIVNAVDTIAEFILWMRPANEKWCYIVTSSPIGWVYAQKDPCERVSQPTCQVETTDFVTNHAPLTHWGRDKMDAISSTTFSSTFSWMKMFEIPIENFTEVCS